MFMFTVTYLQHKKYLPLHPTPGQIQNTDLGIHRRLEINEKLYKQVLFHLISYINKL